MKEYIFHGIGVLFLLISLIFTTGDVKVFKESDNKLQLSLIILVDLIVVIGLSIFVIVFLL